MLAKHDPKVRAQVYAQFNKVQQMINLAKDNLDPKLHPQLSRDIDHELNVLSRLTRIRRQH